MKITRTTASEKLVAPARGTVEDQNDQAPLENRKEIRWSTKPRCALGNKSWNIPRPLCLLPSRIRHGGNGSNSLRSSAHERHYRIFSHGNRRANKLRPKVKRSCRRIPRGYVSAQEMGTKYQFSGVLQTHHGRSEKVYFQITVMK